MSKIGTDHLTRRAYVYIRQSTLDQVHKNLESQRGQYGLAERARELGWQDVEVIDEDLGVLERESSAPDSSGCSVDCVMVWWVRCFASKRRVWRATAVTGTHCLSSAVSLEPC